MKTFAAILYALCAALVAVATMIGMDAPLSASAPPAVLVGTAIGFILATTVIWGVLMAPVIAIRALMKKA